MRTRFAYPTLLIPFVIFIFAILFTLSQPILPVNAAPAYVRSYQVATPITATVATAVPTSVPIPTIPPSIGETSATQYSFGAMVIVVLVLVLLGGLFILLFWWSNKLDQASYLGSLYRDTLEEIEYRHLATALREKLDKGQYHEEVTQDFGWLNLNPEPTLPDGLQPETWGGDTDWNSDPYAGSTTSFSTGSTGGGTELTLNQREDIQKKRATYYHEVNLWRRKVDNEAKKRYHQALVNENDGARKKAKERAASAVSVDLSVLRGRGSEFVLEFTTVVVIIFAVVALGVLRILDTQQIGTLLAAIAGYVLGRSTSRSQSKTGEGVVTESETRTQTNMSELAELLRAMGGAITLPTPSPVGQTAQADKAKQTRHSAKPDPNVAEEVNSVSNEGNKIKEVVK